MPQKQHAGIEREKTYALDQDEKTQIQFDRAATRAVLALLEPHGKADHEELRE